MIKKFSPLIATLLLAAAVSQLFGGSFAAAQTPTIMKPLPSEAVVNQIFDCGWMLVSSDEQSDAQRRAAQAYQELPLKENTRSNIPEYLGKVRAFGTDFEMLRGGGTMGGGYMELQSRQSSYESVLRYFASQKRPAVLVSDPFAPGGDKTAEGVKSAASGSRSWMRTEVGPDVTVNFIVLDKFGGLDATKTAPGITVMCFSEKTSAENAKKLGVIPLTEIQAVLKTGETKPTTWADSIIASGSMQRLRLLAAYSQLTSQQINALLVAADREVVGQMIINKAVLLTPQQLDALANNPEHIDSLALHRFAQLDAPQSAKVMARVSAQTKDMLILRKRDAQADARLMQIISVGNQQTIIAAVSQYGMPSQQHIDRLLSSPDALLRRAAILNIKFAPTPEQLLRIFNDTDAGVRIGMLRRDDVTLSPSLILLAIDHPDKNVQTAYQGRLDYVATTAEIETGLSDADAPKRRGWLMRKNITLTQAQVDRAFNARDTRSFVAARQDIKLTAEQIERCITDDDYSVRDTCVRRPDFEVNPARFVTLMRDKNPNIPETLARESKKRNVDLAPFVDQALAAGDVELVIAISKTRALDITDAQFKAAVALNVPAVRTAFCRREQAKCGS